jgi:hypothetical protein
MDCFAGFCNGDRQSGQRKQQQQLISAIQQWCPSTARHQIPPAANKALLFAAILTMYQS